MIRTTPLPFPPLPLSHFFLPDARPFMTRLPPLESLISQKKSPAVASGGTGVGEQAPGPPVIDRSRLPPSQGRSRSAPYNTRFFPLQRLFCDRASIGRECRHPSPFSSATPGGEGEDLGPCLGDRDSVFEVGRESPVDRDRRPTVVERPDIRAPLVDHGLDRQDHPRLEPHPGTGRAVVRDLRWLVQPPPDPVPHEIPHHRVPQRLHEALH